MLDELGLLKKTQIYATDFNDTVLNKAKAGKYSINQLSNSEKNYVLSGGRQSFTDYIKMDEKFFTVKDYLKEKILFFNHNLVLDKSMNEFQLILCKNVLIYFDDELKQRVTKLFEDSLCVNGFLSIGKNEYLEQAVLKNYKEYSPNKKVFQKCK